MADHAEGGNNVFVYMGGNQRVPRNVTHVRVHKSVKIIRRRAFDDCIYLVSIEMHDGVEIIEPYAFSKCSSLINIKLPGVRVIGAGAFEDCASLADVEFGDNLETIGRCAFNRCTSLRSIRLPTVRVIGKRAFYGCVKLMEAELSENLETIEGWAFEECPCLRHIAMPLREKLLQNNYVFNNCHALSQVDLVGGIQKTISSLLLESWRQEMKDIIDRINQVLPNTPTIDKTTVIQRLMESVLEWINHHKSEHYTLLKNNMTQLELALWDANLPNVDAVASRVEARVTCGANIIIPYVLSFLNDDDAFPLLGYDQAILRDAMEGKGCTNKVQKGVDAAKVKFYKCSSEGCTNQALKGRVCMKHGAKMKRCSSDGCTNQVINGGVCVRHGAKVKRCSSEGCTNHAKTGGVCIKHGAKVERKLCNYEGGCANIAKRGGVCIRHGAVCNRSEGCTSFVKKGGVCTRHGAKKQGKL